MLTCRGPRCLALGADTAQRALTTELDRIGLTDDDVLVTTTGCMFPCTLGPVMAVYPDDVWYGHVDAGLAVEIATAHLADGEPVERGTLRRQ